MKKSLFSYIFLIFLIITFLAGTYIYATGKDFVFKTKENITTVSDIIETPTPNTQSNVPTTPNTQSNVPTTPYFQQIRSSSDDYVLLSTNPYEFIPKYKTVKYLPVNAHSNLYIQDQVVFTPTNPFNTNLFTTPCQTTPYQTTPYQTTPYQTTPYQTTPYQTTSDENVTKSDENVIIPSNVKYIRLYLNLTNLEITNGKCYINDISIYDINNNNISIRSQIDLINPNNKILVTNGDMNSIIYSENGGNFEIPLIQTYNSDLYFEIFLYDIPVISMISRISTKIYTDNNVFYNDYFLCSFKIIDDKNNIIKDVGFTPSDIEDIQIRSFTIQ